MGIVFANNAQTLLNGSISDSATSITVDDATVFNASIGGGNYSYISIDNEILKCTAIAGNVLTVERGVDNTTAAAHSDNARVQQNVTAGSLNDLATEIELEDGAFTLTNKTMDDVSNLIGADHVHYKVKANEALSKGDAIKYVGWNVGESAIEVVKPTSTQDVVIGFVNSDIAIGSFGLAINTGVVKDIDTSAYSDGTILYSDGAGGLTATKPATGYYQELAFVFRSNLNNGVLLVEATAPKEITDQTLNTTDSPSFAGLTVGGTDLGGVEAGADVTDTTNVTAAGALMDSELTNITAVKALDQGVATTDDVTHNTDTVKAAYLSALTNTLSGTAVATFIYIPALDDSDGGAWRYRTQHTSWYQELGQFPAVVGIVATSSSVTLYDMTDPDHSSWMVFDGNSNNMLKETSFSAVAMLNGKLAVTGNGGSVGNFFLVDFIVDKGLKGYSSIYGGTYKGNISQRNDVKGYDNVTFTGWDNFYLGSNDVALTVLPNAPIDSCFVAETEVALADGSSKRIDQVEVGDVVKTLEGEHRVTRWMDQGVKNVIKLEFDGGRKIICTQDHKIRTSIGWVEAGQLTPEHEVIGL